MFRKLYEFIKNRDGATSLEFAIFAVPLFTGILAIIELSYKDILQSELDNKLFTVASDIGINNHTADNGTEFLRNHFCQNIGTVFLRCDQVQIGVRNITGSNRLVTFRDISVIGEWSLGDVDNALIVELNYPVTNFVHPMVIGDIIEREGERFYRSRGVIRREPLLNAVSATP